MLRPTRMARSLGESSTASRNRYYRVLGHLLREAVDRALKYGERALFSIAHKLRTALSLKSEVLREMC